MKPGLFFLQILALMCGLKALEKSKALARFVFLAGRA